MITLISVVKGFYDKKINCSPKQEFLLKELLESILPHTI